MNKILPDPSSLMRILPMVGGKQPYNSLGNLGDSETDIDHDRVAVRFGDTLEEYYLADIDEISIRVPYGNFGNRLLVERDISETHYKQLEEITKRTVKDLTFPYIRLHGVAVSLTPSDSTLLMKLAREGVVEKDSLRRGESREGSIAGEKLYPYNEAENDPNYRAYLADVETLCKERGECVVAYARGKRIAIGKDLAEVVSSIPEEYGGEDILIQEVPDRTINIRPPIRMSP
jgi:hypothetical protein